MSLSESGLLSLSLSLSLFLSNNNYGKLGGKPFLFSLGTVIINWRMCNNYQEACSCIFSLSCAFKSYATAFQFVMVVNHCFKYAGLVFIAAKHIAETTCTFCIII